MQNAKAGGLFRSLLTVFFFILALEGPAQTFKPGQVIEYKVRGSFPEAWERGSIIRELDGGKQYLIRQKPTQFYPEGFEYAYYPGDLRAVKDAKPAEPAPGKTAPPTTPPAPAQKPATPPPVVTTTPTPAPAVKGQGLLTKAEVIAFAKQIFGPGDAFANPRREALLNQIRDLIKARGTDFSVDAEFRDKMNAQGTYSVHISYAVDSNYGLPPKLEDYFGTFLLRVANRGSKSERREGSRVIVTTEDSQHESGALTINRDGTYVWKVFRDDPPAKWLKGKWREVQPNELNVWEGGPALWLEKAKQGQDYMARMGRVPGWPGWIDVGMGAARTPVEYGRRP